MWEEWITVSAKRLTKLALHWFDSVFTATMVKNTRVVGLLCMTEWRAPPFADLRTRNVAFDNMSKGLHF